MGNQKFLCRNKIVLKESNFWSKFLVSWKFFFFLNNSKICFYVLFQIVYSKFKCTTYHTEYQNIRKRYVKKNLPYIFAFQEESHVIFHI